MADGTFTLKKWGVVGNKRAVQGLYTPSTTYLTATPSEWVLLSALGLRQVDRVYVPSHDLLDPAVAISAAETQSGLSVSLVAHAVATTKATIRLWEADGTELADAQNASTRPFYLVFLGT